MKFLHKVDDPNKLVFLNLFEPYLCVAIPGVRNKNGRKIKNINWNNKCDILMI
jgi:hypothetical protein